MQRGNVVATFDCEVSPDELETLCFQPSGFSVRTTVTYCDPHSQERGRNGLFCNGDPVNNWDPDGRCPDSNQGQYGPFKNGYKFGPDNGGPGSDPGLNGLNRADPNNNGQSSADQNNVPFYERLPGIKLVDPTPYDDTILGSYSLYNFINGNTIAASLEYTAGTASKVGFYAGLSKISPLAGDIFAAGAPPLGAAAVITTTLRDTIYMTIKQTVEQGEAQGADYGPAGRPPPSETYVGNNILVPDMGKVIGY